MKRIFILILIAVLLLCGACDHAGKLVENAPPDSPTPSSTATAEAYAVLPSGEVPAVLRGRKLTDEQILALDASDPNSLQASLSTVEDVVAWFDVQNFSYMDGAWLSYGSRSDYGFYNAASDILSEQFLGTDSISIAAMWLLQDDYPGSGIVMAVSKFGPHCNAGCFPINEEYYVLNFAPLVSNTSNKPRWDRLDSLVTDDINSLSALVDNNSQQSEFVSLGFISALNDKICFYLGNDAGFDLSYTVQVIYPLQENSSVSVNKPYTILPSGEVPIALIGRKLTDNQLEALDAKDPESLRASLSTVEDVVAWFNLQEFKYVDGAWYTNSPNSNYGYYTSASDMFSCETNRMYTDNDYYLGTDSVSIAAIWLLQDNYPGAGVLMAANRSGPNCTSGCIPINNEYYVLNFASLIHETEQKPRWDRFDSIVTNDINSLSSLMEKEPKQPEYMSLAFITKLNEKILYYFGGYTGFDSSDTTSILYSLSDHLSLEEYIISSAKNTPSQINLDDFNFPKDLGPSNLSLEEAKALVGCTAELIADKVKTMSDLMLYFYASGFSRSDGDTQLKGGNVTWHFNDSATTAISFSTGNCGATANVVRYLLNGDYDEVGYVCHTYENGMGGGHVYNYIKSNGYYYVFDMTAYTSNGFNPNINAIVTLSSLEEYASKYSEMPGYGNYLPVIYAYQAPNEIPMAWNNNNCNTTWYPNGTKLVVIKEDKENGYNIAYRDLSEEMSAHIEEMRKDRTLTAGDMTDFPGLAAYSLPAEFGGATLSYEQIVALVGQPLETVAKSVKTVEDLLMFLYAAGYRFGGSDLTCDGNGYQLWHFNHFAETVINKRVVGCGQTAALLRYLLDGDYNEVGYMCHTYEDGLGGGHVYNYLKIDDEYFVIDMTQLTSTEYSPKSKAVLAVGSDLNNYGATWPKLFTRGVKVIYAYNSLRELPLSWDYINGVYVTNLPESAKDNVNIILETSSEGYTVGFYPLSDALWEYIDTLR